MFNYTYHCNWATIMKRRKMCLIMSIYPIRRLSIPEIHNHIYGVTYLEFMKNEKKNHWYQAVYISLLCIFLAILKTLCTHFAYFGNILDLHGISAFFSILWMFTFTVYKGFHANCVERCTHHITGSTFILESVYPHRCHSYYYHLEILW